MSTKGSIKQDKTFNSKGTISFHIMKLSIIPSVLALASCALAAPGTLKPFLKRNPTGSFSLVAYSLDSSVVDIFYSDGM